MLYFLTGNHLLNIKDVLARVGVRYTLIYKSSSSFLVLLSHLILNHVLA